MRYVILAIFLCAVDVPVASALPIVNANAVSVSKAEAVVPAAKRSKPRVHRHSRGSGGIHPLVGSGDY